MKFFNRDLNTYKIFGREPVVFFTSVLTVLGVIAQIVQGIIEEISAGKTLTDIAIMFIVGGGIVKYVRPKVSPVTPSGEVIPKQ